VYPAVCRGEMWGHTDEVKLLLKLTETSFASGGNDNLIIHWKDGDLESLGRNSEAFLSLLQGNAHRLLYKKDIFLESQVNLPSTPLSNAAHDDDQDDSSSGLVTANEDYEFDEDDVDDRNEDDDTPKRYFHESDSTVDLSVLQQSKDEMATQSEDTVVESANNQTISIYPKSHFKSVRLPTYILDHAENLLFEHQKTLLEIQEYLQSQGHSKAIVDAVIVKLKQTHNM